VRSERNFVVQIETLQRDIELRTMSCIIVRSGITICCDYAHAWKLKLDVCIEQILNEKFMIFLDHKLFISFELTASNVWLCLLLSHLESSHGKLILCKSLAILSCRPVPCFEEIETFCVLNLPYS